MTIRNITTIYNILKTMRLNKFEDKDTRKNLILLYINMGNVVKDFDKKQSEIKESYFLDKQEEIQQMTEIEQKILSESNPENKKLLIEEQLKHLPTYELINEFNKVIIELLETETEVKFTKINRELFIDSLVDDITFEQIEMLSPIFE